MDYIGSKLMIEKSICHLTSAHARGDTRIFVKQCKSLAKEGFDTSLIVADGLGNSEEEDIVVFDVGKSKSRIGRIFKSARKVYHKALEVDADIYHLHDPELIPYGLKLLKRGKKVVFDAHEDLPMQILSKYYLNKYVAHILSRVVRKYESYACSKMSAVVAATPFIRNKFLKINSNTIDVNNYPKLSEIDTKVSWSEKKNSAVYIGGIAKIRGIREIVKALEYTKGVRLDLAGSFINDDIESEVKGYPQWSKVVEHGYLNRKSVADLLLQSKVGLVTLYPQKNYLDSLPVKMFEYMNAGIPVIASNFSYWNSIIEENICGVTVNPLDPKAIGEAIGTIISNDVLAEEMGKNGRQAILTKYNWSIEFDKLRVLYQDLLENK